MIQAAFQLSPRGILSARVTGHAGFAPSGEDIVCASVSSAVMMAANGITEVLGFPAEVFVEEDDVFINLGDFPEPAAAAFLQALRLHLELLRQQYPKNITITVTEV